MAFKSNRTIRLLRAGGETETRQENVRDWLDLDEGGPGFQLLTEEQIAAVIFFIYFQFSIYLFFLGGGGYLLYH
jgi:hypothetical protein